MAALDGKIVARPASIPIRSDAIVARGGGVELPSSVDYEVRIQ